MFCCAAAEEERPVLVVPAGRARFPEPPAPDAAEESIFEAVLERMPAELWGIRADFADDKTLHICELTMDSDCPLVRYNVSEPRRQIKRGDYFLSVNGTSRETLHPRDKLSSAFQQELTSHFIEVQVCRPCVFEVKIRKGEQDLGLKLSYSNNGISLIIVDITDGAVRTAAPEVKQGDRIVGVDGVEGTPFELLSAIRSAKDEVRLQISRPCLCA